METNKDNIVKTSEVPTQIALGGNTSLDLSWLPEEERKQLVMGYYKGIIDISTSVHSMQAEASGLKRTLDDLSDKTREVAGNGQAITITHMHNTKNSRTEVVMGNSIRAYAGKTNSTGCSVVLLAIFFVMAVFLTVVAASR